MPLAAADLEGELLNLSDQAAANQQIPYTTLADAMQIYGAGMQFPPPAGLGAATSAMQGILGPLPTNVENIPALKLAFQLWAMNIMIGFPANPADLMAVPTMAPAGQPPIDSVLSTPTDDAATRAKNLASVIDTWVKTGTYDNGVAASGVPAPVIVPWG